MKIVLFIILGIVVLVVAGILIAFLNMRSFVKLNFKVHAPNETIKEGGEKQALVLYQPSKHNGAKGIADAAADVLHENGYTVTVNLPSPSLSYDLDAYDVLVFGCSVYAGAPSKTLCEYLEANPFAGKKAVVFAVGIQPNERASIEKLAGCVSAGNEIHTIKLANTEKSRIQELLTEKILETA